MTIEKEQRIATKHPFRWRVVKKEGAGLWSYACFSKLRGFHRVYSPTLEQAIENRDLNNDLEKWDELYTPELTEKTIGEGHCYPESVIGKFNFVGE